MKRRQQLAQLNQHLKIPPQYNGIVPIKIIGPVIKEHMAYFITDEIQQRVETPTLISLTAFTRSNICQHLSFKLYQ